MSFRNIFSTNSNIYHRFFSRNLENRQNFDEIIVFPNQMSSDSQSSNESPNGKFLNVENLVDFVEAPEFQSFLNDQNKVLVLRVETSSKLSSIDFAQMNRMCSTNSMVILLTTNERTKFHLYWKSKQIKHFLGLRSYERFDFMNDIRLFEFLTSFFGDSLKRGHLGISKKVPIKPGGTALAIEFLADYRDFNLLLLAAEIGYTYIVEIMLKLDQDTECHGMNAQTLAWKNRHFEVLLILLKANLIYPYSIFIDECPDDIQKFYEVSRELNEAILVKDKDKVLRIISQNTEMIHFYNLNNESALAFAVKHKLFDMYRLLISKNKQFGPHERFDEIKEDMKESELEILREIHYNEAKFLPDNHMHILLSNSRLGLDTSNAEMKYKSIQNAFEYLNGNTLIQIILKIVAASRSCSIVFDFNRDSVEVVDPTVDASTDGLFYLFGRIYIGAKKLTDKDMKFEVFGVLAHELCHYAMKLVYRNYAKPYFSHDFKTKKTFTEISRFCQENAGNVPLIDIVHLQYHQSMHHAELIVRVPHLIMKYLNNPEKLNRAKTLFPNLFEIYEEKILPDMKKALPRIESDAETEKKKSQKKVRKLKIVSIVVMLFAVFGVILGIFVTRKIFYKPIYKFSLLSHDDQVRVENAPVIYKHVDLMFHDLFPHNSSAYYSLTSDDILQMLDKNPLDFSNPHLYYLNDFVTFEWRNLTTRLKNKFLASNFTFQNESITFKNMNVSNSDIFNSLTSNQIIDVLDGKPFIIHKMIKNEAAFYTERTMFTEYIYPIYYLFMKKLNRDKNQIDCVYKNQTGHANETFEIFYNDFITKNFDDLSNETNYITHIEYYSRCSSSDFKIINLKTGETVDSLYDHKTFQKGFDEILIENGLKSNTSSSRMFILSADAGTGKTETFRQFALRIKRMYPTRWVSYIDYRQNKKFEWNLKNIDDAKRALAGILKIDLDNQFEKRIYEELFDKGRLILLWDGFDHLSQKLMFFFGSVCQLIKNYTTNIQFISTKAFYSEYLRRNFKVVPYTFVPLMENSKIAFLHDLFVSQHIKEQDIVKYINKTQKIVDSTKSDDNFNTPLLLGMIAYIISNDTDIFQSENLYQLYEKFLQKKLQVWLDNVSEGKKLIEILLMNGIGVSEFYQKYAFGIIKDGYLTELSRFSSLKLKISARRLPKELDITQISEMGILHFNDPKVYTFAHSTFVQFFIAQFIVNNIFNTETAPSTEEADIRIQAFFWFIRDKGTAIFVESYFKSKNSDNMSNIDPQILMLFQTKYKNFLVNMLQSRSIPIAISIEFFQKDHRLLTFMLLNDSNRIYPATFNYAYLDVYSIDDIKRTAISKTAEKYLTADEYKQFISLDDYNAIILYTMYCVKQFRNSSKYARESFPGYDLSDEIFDNDNVSEVLTAIVKSATKNETIKLITSEAVWYVLKALLGGNGPIVSFRDNKLEFYETLLNLIEINLNEHEQKNWFSKILKFPFLLEDVNTREFLLSKVNKLFLNSEIHEIFTILNILHYAVTIGNFYTYIGRFEYSWNYFVARTNWKQQKSILSQSVKIECLLNQIDESYCYAVPKINLLQASILENIRVFGINNSSIKSFQNMIKVYTSYFNDVELQQLIIKGSKEFIPFLIFVRTSKECKAYADFLVALFNGNDSLKTFLLEPVEPTKLNIFELLFDLYDNRENFKIFKRLVGTEIW